MNIIAFFELKPDDFDKAIKKFQEVITEREKETGKFPKAVYGPVSMGGQWKGFAIYENPSNEQLNAMILHYKGVMTFKFVPIFDSVEIIEQYMKSK
jgi:hypothetical protein